MIFIVKQLSFYQNILFYSKTIFLIINYYILITCPYTSNRGENKSYLKSYLKFVPTFYIRANIKKLVNI